MYLARDSVFGWNYSSITHNIILFPYRRSETLFINIVYCTVVSVCDRVRGVVRQQLDILPDKTINLDRTEISVGSTKVIC